MRSARIRTTPSPWALWLRRLVWTINALVLVVASGAGGFVLGALSGLQPTLPDARQLADYRPRLTTEIYSTELQPDGTEKHTLLARLYRENREWASLDEIPINLINATVAIEDRYFFKHRGIDPKGIIRAAIANLRAGRVRQGGSTITQQLVRAVWLSPERTITRKLREILLALQVERNFTKEEILEMYLNEVCYGHGAYGVKAAAELYFGKEPRDLTLAECALLAGLPRWPAGYSPYQHPDRAKRRRQQVLQAMVRAGYITPQQAAKAAKAPLEPGNGLQPLREVGFATFRAPHFTHLVVRFLCERYGVTPVYEGGLRVYTTLDMRLQKAAEEEMTKHIEALRKRGQLKPDLRGQGALVCLAVKTGDVLAMVGGVGPFQKVQFNRAYPGGPPWGRQAGSAFKPYVWATALEAGYGPTTTVSGEPIAVRVGPGRYWRPRGGHGYYTLASALQHSINRVSVRLVLALGPERVQRRAAEMMGIPPSRLRPVPSLALGTSEVAPLEMAVGFSCFASGGLRPRPRFWRRITDYEGRVLVDVPPYAERVLAPEVAKSMVDMMKRVISGGTGTRARIPGPCAGKTGTAQDARDVWFVGYTPDLCTAIWIGNDDHSPIRGRAYGGTLCAPVWGKFMKRAIKIYPFHGQFPSGPGVKAKIRSAVDKKKTRVVTLCKATGKLATPYCPETYEKAFGPDEPLPGKCRLHGPSSVREGSRAPPERPAAAGGGGEQSAEPGGTRRVTVCVDSGQLATPYCPNTVERTFAAGHGPTTSCPLHGPGPGRRERAVDTGRREPEAPATTDASSSAGPAGGGQPEAPAGPSGAAEATETEEPSPSAPVEQPPAAPQGEPGADTQDE